MILWSKPKVKFFNSITVCNDNFCYICKSFSVFRTYDNYRKRLYVYKGLNQVITNEHLDTPSSSAKLFKTHSSNPGKQISYCVNCGQLLKVKHVC